MLQSPGHSPPSPSISQVSVQNLNDPTSFSLSSSAKNPRVLDEDTNVKALDKIIERDYFPDISKVTSRTASHTPGSTFFRNFTPLDEFDGKLPFTAPESKEGDNNDNHSFSNNLEKLNRKRNEKCGYLNEDVKGIEDVKRDRISDGYGTSYEPPSTLEGSNDSTKLRSRDQRLALQGEPKCVICGRYGEYICDETDDDVCSLECKQALLCRTAKSLAEKIPIADECFYVSDADNKSGTAPMATDLRTKLDIHVKGDVVAPVLSFSACNLPDKLLHNIDAAGYDMPTPVQMQAIPAALTGKNMLVLANTGSGKSASFLIPIVSRCVIHRREYLSDKKKPLAMVLTPTRELCIQVEEHAKMLGKGLPFKTALVVGGEAMAGQLHRIQQGVELIVGTPGRLVDLLSKHEIDLDDVMTFVVDEVDCLLQRGFRDQVMQIYRALSQPQVLMYSATMSNDIEKMINTLGKDTMVISVGEPNRANKAVKQIAIWVESKQKKQKLFDILTTKKHFKPPVVVYVSSRLGADLLANAITVATGIKAVSIHGEKSMKERREIMQSFFMGEFPVVVSTGVLGRGIDLLGVRQVIVFDMPNSIKEYVHQIGRASRMGEEGEGIVFVNEENKNVFADLIDVLKSGGAAVPRELANSRYTTGFFSGGKASKKRKNTG